MESVEPLRVNYIGNLVAEAPGGTLSVISEVDFLTVCNELRRNVAEDYQAVWIHKKHHYAWLKVYIENFGVSTIRSVDFAEITPHDVLEQKWGLKVPSWLTDVLIVEGKLLDLSPPQGNWGSADSILLADLFGELGEQLPLKHAGSIVEKASELTIRTALSSDAVRHQAWTSLVKRWAETAAASWVPGFCERLLSDPEKLWRQLTIWRLLHRYPAELLDFALEPVALGFVRTVPVNSLEGMSLHPIARSLALDQIRPYFAQVRKTKLDRKAFASLAEAVSGELQEEFNELETLLQHPAFTVESSDIQAVVERFVQCGSVGASAIARLRLFVRPPQPSTPDPDSVDADAWVNWFHKEYLPYRWWQTERGEHDALVEKSVGNFSEWYCHEFPHVHSDLQRSAMQVISGWKTSILKDTVSLILVVDNLPWFFWESFERAFAAAGLLLHESRDCFAPLPSRTSTCKPALISGTWDASGSDYKKMLEQRSAHDWNGRAVQYLPGADQLSTIGEPQEPCVLLLNYLASDVTLHADAAAAGTTHAADLDHLYQGLAKTVGEFAKRVCREERGFGLYVVTDHGSTCTLPSERQNIDAQLSKKLFPEEKYRSASFDKEVSIPDNLWQLGHQFTNPMATDGLVHFIPRGHNTVAAGSNRKVYSHGGATPEEVITPCGVFRLFRAAWTPPNVRFLNLKMKNGKAAFWIKRMSNIEIEIQNPNTGECHLESISIFPEIGEVRDFTHTSVPSSAVGAATMSLYFDSGAKTVTTLRFDLTFRVAQETLTRSIELPVEFGSVTGGLDLNDLLS